MDNVQFATLMTAVDNVVATTNHGVYQGDVLIGLILALIFITSFRWHL